MWFAIFGGAAIDVQRAAAPPPRRPTTWSQVDGAASVNFDGALFELLDQYPLASVTTVLVMVLVGIFFVSGADAASIVMGTLSERGTIEPSPSYRDLLGRADRCRRGGHADRRRTGGDASSALTGLQNITIVSALPFVLVMAGLCVALVKDLRRDPLMLRAELGNQLMEQAVIAGVVEHGHEDFAIVLEPNEDSDSARADADAERRRPLHGDRRVLPCRSRCRRCVVGSSGTAPGVTPRHAHEGRHQVPGPGGGLRAVRPLPTGRIRVPEVGRLVSGSGPDGASGRG